MRVPVLITMTLAFGTMALLESVMRPVSEALVDCASTGADDDRTTTAKITAVRKVTIGEFRMLHERAIETLTTFFLGTLTSSRSLLLLKIYARPVKTKHVIIELSHTEAGSLQC